MKKIFLLIGICIVQAGFSQKYDYQWPMGYGSNFSKDFGVSILNFNNGKVTVFHYAEVDNFGISDKGSFICSREGELILMTNNCRIIDKNFKTIPDSDELNPGRIHNLYCGTRDYDWEYPALQGILILPEPKDDSTLYAVHKDLELWSDRRTVGGRNIYLEIVQKKEDGSFYVKEKKVLLNSEMLPNFLMACLNNKKDGWWVWTADYDTNRIHSFLIGGNSIVHGPFTSESGPNLTTEGLLLVQSNFSPNSKWMVLNSRAKGIMLYRFDNETGAMEYDTAIRYPNMESAYGMSFSPDSRFVYVTTAEDIYQIEVEDPDSTSSIVHIAHYTGRDETNWPIGLGYMNLGPDCRLYVSPGTTTYYIHVIHHPNEKGVACQFEPQAIRFPTNLLGTFPNMPMYRYDGACDSTILWGITSSSEPEWKIAKEVKLYPNPASDLLTFQFPKSLSKPATVRLFNQLGEAVSETTIAKGQREVTLPVSHLPKGMYFYAVQSEGAVIDAGKVVVAR